MAKNKRGVAHSARRRRQRERAERENAHQTAEDATSPGANEEEGGRAVGESPGAEHAEADRRSSLATYNCFDLFEWVEMAPLLPHEPASDAALLW